MKKRLKKVKLNIKISDDILKKTTKCHKRFSCLSGAPRPACKVVELVGIVGALTDCEDQADCEYCIPYGVANGSSFCTCPVRIELYRRYKI